MGILQTVGNNNSNRRMSFSSIGIGIGDGNIIMFLVWIMEVCVTGI